MNVSLRDLIYDDRSSPAASATATQLKCVIPGGSSVPVLLPDQIDIPASFDGIAKAGSLLGSAGIIVMDETTCMVWAAENLLHFYKHESCGKCTPCREGGDWLHRILGKIERGEGADARPRPAALDRATTSWARRCARSATRRRRRCCRRSRCSAPSTRRTFARAAARCRRRGARRRACTRGRTEAMPMSASRPELIAQLGAHRRSRSSRC